MARIKIKDLPRDRKISKEEMKKILGGISSEPVYLRPNIRGGIYNLFLSPLPPGSIKGIIDDG
jgi:hypothetical protein